MLVLRSYIFASVLSIQLALAAEAPSSTPDELKTSAAQGDADASIATETSTEPLAAPNLQQIHNFVAHVMAKEPMGSSNRFKELSDREKDLYESQKQIMVLQEHQAAVNRRLRAGYINGDSLKQFAESSSSQTLQAISTVNKTMQPYSRLVRGAVGNYLLSPYLGVVTDGAVLYNLALARQKLERGYYNEVHEMADSYGSLATFSEQSSLDATRLKDTVHSMLSLLV